MQLLHWLSFASYFFDVYLLQTQTVKHTSGLFQYFDKNTQEETSVEITAYESEQSNGHLIMIANGALVPAEEYETVSLRLAERGYPVLVANYYFNETGGLVYPNLDLLHSILPELINQTEDLPKLVFEDVIILGHSFGGFFAIYDATSEDQKEALNISSRELNFLPDSSSELWDEYVKGIFIYEGWGSTKIPVPSAQFLVAIGSTYRSELIEGWKESFPKSYNASFYIVNDANHFLINNFHGPEQVVPGAFVATGQDNFTTTLQEWDIGQNLFVDIVDYEIQQRLDGNQEAVSIINSIKLALDGV